ncbi:hypothetical protein [Spongiactinospora sp. TRM90649]|uniref:hypothetical protein n=1 Tax=Spongiactinospora sp. TRM90649 TaxID=3031114 RepID=UPI0023F7814A|nr:hypothetical protein [Spongiactinospora sp. TRM90649]MDF5758256.1 hypothetical protein [Spongiactinospora sp. TRM90649]
MSDDNKRAIRTAFQTFIGVAVALPGIFDAVGVRESIPWLAGSLALAVAGVLSRVMALSSVQRLLPPWLRIDAPSSSDQTRD